MIDIGIFRCPVCERDLTSNNKSLVCENGHCFDISSSGYVNLLPVQKMNSKVPGDSREMVSSRRKFLSKNYYKPLRDELCGIIKKYSRGNDIIFDSGSGEGYYTKGFADAAEDFGGKVFGADISKIAVEKASKSVKNASFAVASAYCLPIADNSVDFLTDIFSPLALSEFKRVIKNGGYFIYVVPAEKHLFKMKSVLYENPYENGVSKPDYDGFAYIESRKITFEIFLDNNDDIMSLFNMTPYLWRTPKDGILRLSKQNELSDSAEFYIHLLKKTSN